MLDKSIDGALLALRKQVIRGDGVGLAHVEALLVLRKVPMPRVLPPKRPDVALCGLQRRMVLGALADGPRTMRELVAYVAAKRPDIPPASAYQRTGQALARMKGAGLVMREGRLWRLAQCEQPPALPSRGLPVFLTNRT